MFGGRIGWPEITLILVIVLIIFGAGKLPSIGTALGKSIREFKSASKSAKKEATDDVAVASTKDETA